MHDALTAAWPLNALELRCGSLTLRPSTENDAVAQAEISHRLLTPEQYHFMPGITEHGEALEVTTRRTLQRLWSLRGTLCADDWGISFAVLDEGDLAGEHSLYAQHFTTTRRISTGVFVDPDRQGRGLAMRARLMVLEFAFAHLGATSALHTYAEGNEASRRLGDKIGYEPHREEVHVVEGREVGSFHLLLTDQRWAEVRPPWLDGFSVAGLDPVLDLLGAHRH